MSNPLNYLYEAVGWVFTHIYDGLKPIFGASSGWTWALSIVILVVLMRLIMVPLFIKQMHTTRAMAKLQPQMSALRKKYKNDKQTLNQETMKLYQEAGVNPLMGCLPFALQLPLFYGLFEVLRAIADYHGGTPSYGLPAAMVQAGQQAKILGATIADKVLFTGPTQHVPLHAKLVILMFVVISMVTTFLSVRQSQKRGMMPTTTPDNPMGGMQKYMTYFMPLFALTGLYWQFGLVLYWVTTNVWTLGQQFILGRRYPYTPPATEDSKSDGTQAQAAKPATMAARLFAGRAQQGQATGRAQQGQASGRAQQNGSRPARGPVNGTAARANGSSGGGLLKRFGKARAEPAQEAETPEVRVVRRQTQRQSRSKRTGKR